MDSALELFNERGIDPDLAYEAGVRWGEGVIAYPNGRERPLHGDGPKMKQPPGQALEAWWLTERGAHDEVIVCEGETDALAALSADAGVGVLSIPGSSFPPEKIVDAIPVEVNKVYLAFDNDEAGCKATEKVVAEFFKDDALPPGLAIVGLDEGCDLAQTLAEDTMSLTDLLLDAEDAEAPVKPQPEQHRHASLVKGDEFIFTEKNQGPPIWGQGTDILWISGEPMLICAAPGIGKTTIAQQVALGMIGLAPADLMGFQIRQLPADDKVLYIAADRPAQAVRSFRRMVKEEDQPTLAERLRVWRGPFNIERLAETAENNGCSTIFVDSLAAVAGGELQSDATGMKIYHALQECVAAGLEVCVLHHNRKKNEANNGWLGLDEVYGSRWITAVPGSVLYIQGRQGEPDAVLRHLKMPAAPVHMKIHHEHHKGRTYSDKQLPGPSEDERRAVQPVAPAPLANGEGKDTSLPPTIPLKGLESAAVRENRSETFSEGVSVLARTQPGGDLALPERLSGTEQAAEELGVGLYD